MPTRNTDRSSETAAAVQPLCAAAGTELARVRIARGNTVADVADRLLLSPRQVEALEDGDTHVFQSSSYYLTALRRYAAFAEIDSSLVSKVGEAMRGTPVPRAAGNTRLFARAALVLLAVAAGVGVWWWAVRTHAPSESDGSAAVAPIPTIVFSQDPSTPSVSFGSSTQDSSTPSGSVGSSRSAEPGGRPAAAVADAATPAAPSERLSTVPRTAPRAATPAPTRAPAPAPAPLRPPPFSGAFGALRVRDATWVLIRDANDSVVGRTLPADSAFPLDSAPTYLAVGTPNVDLFVGSRRVDVAEYVVNGQIEMRTPDFASLAEREGDSNRAQHR